MNILIIAAHGSRKKESNQEVIKLTHRLSQKVKKSYDQVEPAFLQFADPLLENQLDTLAGNQPERIVIFPFFIGSGSHILTDIPTLVKEAKEKFPTVEFAITRHLGKLASIEDAIVEEVLL